MTGPETFFGVKIATFVIALVGGVVSVLVEFRNHDIFTATSSVVAGVFMAIVATEPSLDLLRQLNWFTVHESWGYALAAGYGITGRNLVMYLKRASQDPIKTFKAVWPWGKK